MPTKLVAVTDSVFPDLYPAREVLASIGADIRFANEPEPDAILEVASQADAILTTYAKISAGMISQLKCCRVIARFGIGVDNVDIGARRSPVSLSPEFPIAVWTKFPTTPWLCSWPWCARFQSPIRAPRPGVGICAR